MTSDGERDASTRKRTRLQVSAERLFGLSELHEVDLALVQKKIRKAIRDPKYWKPTTEDRLHERIGSGTYGAVYRGTRAEGGEVAIKTITIDSEKALSNAVCEFLIQDLVYSAYDESASSERWAPVHPPFPTLYGVVGHKSQIGYEMRASMFIFQCGERTMRAQFSTIMQLASVLCHLHTATSMRFMHRDLHWNNVLRRTKSKPVNLPLFCTDSSWSLVKGKGAFKRSFPCGPEAAIIDFGLAWAQLSDGQVIQPSTKGLYPTDCAFNPQHDLRQFVVSAFSVFCIDPTTMKMKPLATFDAFATFVADLIDRARSQSPRFALYTSLKTIRTITHHIRALVTSGRHTFESWLDDIHTPFFEVGGTARWQELYVPFILDFKSIWKSVWKTKKMPSLTHFQYGNAITITDTPCFEPNEVLSFAAQCWK